MSETKPREWWITRERQRGDWHYATYDREDIHTESPIHVIEKSAYDAVVAERDTWKSEHDNLSKFAEDERAKADKYKAALAGLLAWAEVNHEMPNYSEVIRIAREALAKGDE